MRFEAPNFDNDPVPLRFSAQFSAPDFDGLTEGKAVRDEILSSFENRKGEWLDAARSIGVAICLERGGVGVGDVTADDIHERFELLYPGVWKQWAGSIFKAKYFEATGEIRLSPIPEYHANKRCVWRLRYNPRVGRV